MDPALYFGIYGEGVDQQVISKYAKYVELYYLHNSVKDHIWGD